VVPHLDEGLGGSGIGKLHPATLVPLTSLGLDDVERGLGELEARDYLRRDGAIVWLVENVREQGLNPRNANHRVSVNAHLRSLELLSPDLVAEFRAHHVTWLQPTTGPGTEDAPAPDAGDHRDTIEIPSGYYRDTSGI
jgi:hypothetical protein